MKYALFALLLRCQAAFGQSDTTVYVKELGWTFVLPPGFKVLDTATINAESRARESEIHWIRKPNPSDTNYSRLILWARDNDKNSFHITCMDSSHIKPPDSLRKKLAVEGLTTKTEVPYGGVKFTQTRIEMSTPPHPYIMINCISGYKGKRYLIAFAGPAAVEQAYLHMLQTSRFDR